MSDQGEDIQVKDTSVDDDVRAAFESLKTPTQNETETAKVETVEKPQGTETQEQADQRARDEAGRFAKAPKESSRVKAEGAQEQAKAPVIDTAAQGAPAGNIKAPIGWSAPMKEEFLKLPPNVQAEITRRETEIHREFTSRDEDRNFGKDVKETAAPFLATILSEGGSVKEAFQQFLTTAQILRGNNQALKVQALQSIAQKYNVELNSPLQPGAAPQVRPEQVTQIVQAELNKQRQFQESRELKSEIEQFAADPANVHFEAVKLIMAALMQSGAAENLRDAYDQAIHARPDIRSTLAAQQLAEQESKRSAEAKAKADAAKRASGSIAGGPGAAIPNGTPIDRSLDEELRANFRAIQGGRI